MAIISKKQFVDIINFMKKQDDFSFELSNLFDKYNSNSNIEYYPNYDLLVDILKVMFDDENDFLGYWIFDSQFGQQFFYDKNLILKDHNNKKIESPEQMYDFLIYNMSNNNINNYNENTNNHNIVYPKGCVE